MPRRPNILWIISDDHRSSALRAHGDPTVRTPNLDRLVERGVTFTQARHMGSNSGAVCMPSRACLHTGVHLYASMMSHGLGPKQEFSQATLRPELPTLGQTFRNAGYETFITGKWHNDVQSLQRSFAQGRDIFMEGMCNHYRVPVCDLSRPEESRLAQGHSSDVFSQAAIDYLLHGRGGSPFLLYLAFTAPHDPRHAPPQYHDLYPPATVPLPPNFAAEHPFDLGDIRIRDEKLAAFPRSGQEIQRHIADYYAMITHMDHCIGQVLAALRTTGQWDDTLVVYTADHGLAVGQHGLMGKQNLYEHSTRVPLILAGPGLPSGERRESLCRSYDLFPTLCELAELPTPSTVTSRSLLKPASPRSTVCLAYKDLQRAVTDGRWKLIRYRRSLDGQKGCERTQLFDLAADPWETRDLSGDPEHQATIRRLTQALHAWQRRVGDPVAF